MLSFQLGEHSAPSSLSLLFCFFFFGPELVWKAGFAKTLPRLQAKEKGNAFDNKSCQKKQSSNVFVFFFIFVV
jgi:hypothetical protein